MISLSSRDSRPVWDQVTAGIAHLLRQGAFLPGESLPPPEQLACRLVLNPTAVRRAYQELRERGALDYNVETTAYTVAERRETP